MGRPAELIQINRFGFVTNHRASPRTAVADPAANSAEIIDLLTCAAGSDLVLFPELCVTGYTFADLFGQSRFCKRASGASGRSPERPPVGRS